MDYGSGASRRQTNQSAQNYGQSYGQYDSFTGDQTYDQSFGQTYGQPYPQQFNQFYTPYSSYEEQQQVPQLFEDTSSQMMPNTDFYEQSNANFAPQVYGMNASTLINQQVIVAAGQQLLSNSIPALDVYSQSIVNRGKTWIGSNVKYYFAVDTTYVLKKLMLIFFPFSHKDWSLKFSADEPIAPRDDINAPDLYIPSMAFVTYILVCGYILGLQNRFSPEHLGIQASSALAWLLLEVVVVLVALYLLNISCSLGFFHMISYGGYKFVCIVATLLASLPFNNIGYYASFAYCSLSLGFFLMRSLHISVQTVTQSNRNQSNETRNGLYLVLIICFVQPFIIYFLTRNFIAFSTAV